MDGWMDAAAANALFRARAIHTSDDGSNFRECTSDLISRLERARPVIDVLQISSNISAESRAECSKDSRRFYETTDGSEVAQHIADAGKSDARDDASDDVGDKKRRESAFISRSTSTTRVSVPFSVALSSVSVVHDVSSSRRAISRIINV